MLLPPMPISSSQGANIQSSPDEGSSYPSRETSQSSGEEEGQSNSSTSAGLPGSSSSQAPPSPSYLQAIEAKKQAVQQRSMELMKDLQTFSNMFPNAAQAFQGAGQAMMQGVKMVLMEGMDEQQPPF